MLVLLLVDVRVEVVRLAPVLLAKCIQGGLDVRAVVGSGLLGGFLFAGNLSLCLLEEVPEPSLADVDVTAVQGIEDVIDESIAGLQNMFLLWLCVASEDGEVILLRVGIG